MAAEFPYMLSVKNLAAILDRIKDAGTPPKFTGEFLKTNLGFASSTDRGIIPLLRTLGFITPDGIPTPRYNDYRDAGRSGTAMAVGLREGWAPLFLSDQKAHEKTAAQLKELFKNVSGKGESVAEKMATTFKALALKADWSSSQTAIPVEPVEPDTLGPAAGAPIQPETVVARGGGVALHHDIHIHLPPTSDVSVYAAIFRALRSELLD